MKMKGFFAIIVALIFAATCILGSITPRDEDEGIGFGIIGVIFAVIIIAAACIASKENSRLNDSVRIEIQRKDAVPTFSKDYSQAAAPRKETGH